MCKDDRNSMKRWFARMGVRDRLMLAVLLTTGLALVSMTVAFNFILSSGLASDADRRLRDMANDTTRSIRIENGLAYIPRSAEDIRELGSQVWVFISGGVAFSPLSVDPAISAAASSLDGGEECYLNVPEHEVRLYGVPLYHADERIGTVVTGLVMTSYMATQRITLISTIAFTAVLMIIVVFAGSWALNAAFKPVLKMTKEAEEWSIEDLDRRFNLGDPHDELTELAYRLDGMLDRLGAGLRHEQRFSAEVSHQLRTPVAKIKAEAELALRRERDLAYYQEALGSVLHSADQMTHTVEVLLAASQKEGSLAIGRADVWQVLSDVTTSLGVLMEENGVEVQVKPPARDLCVGVESDIVVQIIQPVVENACRFAKSKVLLSVSRKGKEVYFLIEDDGPGVAHEEEELIFEPGVRGSAASSERHSRRGAGLGLSLARRLARAANGDVEVERNNSGAHFVVHLPAG